MPFKYTTSFVALFMGTFGLFAQSASSKITPKDTTSPNQFSFTSAEYVVTEDATNAVVTVSFYPGNRGWSGVVNYSTSDGTAIAGQDYTHTSGTLSFNYVPYQTFTIPIHMDSEDEGEETINLTLWQDGAYISQSNAVVRIQNAKPLPKIQIRPATGGSLSISWADNGVSYVVEKSNNFQGDTWTQVSSPVTKNSGNCSLVDSINGELGFYRLRKDDTQAP